MVWFQCETCGESLKKPKLASHFWKCAAERVSCIDCGATFDQKSVQNHTSCFTEMEKYGPKSNGKPITGQQDKSNTTAEKKLVSGADTSQGLSERAPWRCSLCNVQATSQETLLAHAAGKKHISKCNAAARAEALQKSSAPENGGQSAPQQQQQPPQGAAEEEEKKDEEDKENASAKKKKKKRSKEMEQNGHGDDLTSKEGAGGQHEDAVNAEGSAKKAKKGKERKLEGVGGEANGKRKAEKGGGEMEGEENGNASGGFWDKLKAMKEGRGKGGGGVEGGEEKMGGKRAKEDAAEADGGANGASGKKRKGGGGGEEGGESMRVAWNKLVSRVLKNTPERALKVRKLEKAVLPLALETTGRVEGGESLLKNAFAQWLEQTSKVIVEGKTVRLPS